MCKRLVEEGTGFGFQIKVIADLVARKQFRYRLDSYNYKYCVESSSNKIYSNIFKHCENAVRERYGHKGKLNADAYFTNANVKVEFEARLGAKAKEIIDRLISQVAPLDETTDIILYAQNASRWKIKFGEVTEQYKGDGKKFVEAILQLGKLNERNPSIENIFLKRPSLSPKTTKKHR